MTIKFMRPKSPRTATEHACSMALEQAYSGLDGWKEQLRAVQTHVQQCLQSLQACESERQLQLGREAEEKGRGLLTAARKSLEELVALLAQQGKVRD